jgi:hypothetical protein
LFILGGLGHFQALRGEPSVVVRLAHLRGSPNSNLLQRGKVPNVPHSQSTPLEPTAVLWSSQWAKWPRVEFKTASAPVVTVEINTARLKTILIAAVAAVLFALSTWTVQVQGQSTTTPAIAPAPRINLTAEQEFIIREIVLKDLNVPKAKPDAPETIGDAVPENIELHPIPPDVAAKVPKVKSHEFFVKDDKIIIVSPSDRLVADVIKKAE